MYFVTLSSETSSFDDITRNPSVSVGFECQYQVLNNSPANGPSLPLPAGLYWSGDYGTGFLVGGGGGQSKIPAAQQDAKPGCKTGFQDGGGGGKSKIPDAQQDTKPGREGPGFKMVEAAGNRRSPTLNKTRNPAVKDRVSSWWRRRESNPYCHESQTDTEPQQIHDWYYAKLCSSRLSPGEQIPRNCRTRTVLEQRQDNSSHPECVTCVSRLGLPVDLALLISAWPGLSVETRAEIAALARQLPLEADGSLVDHCNSNQTLQQGLHTTTNSDSRLADDPDTRNPTSGNMSVAKPAEQTGRIG